MASVAGADRDIEGARDRGQRRERISSVTVRSGNEPVSRGALATRACRVICIEASPAGIDQRAR